MTTHTLPNRGATRVDPKFVDGPNGQLLFTIFRPVRPLSQEAAVVCLPPFAEEMNKSRRMLAMQARQIAAEGLLFLLPDLYGTGDSAGDFADADHDLWCRDLQFAVEWLRASGVTDIRFLAVRYGSLFLQSCLPCTQQMRHRVVLWDPVLSGKTLLDQFLRTKMIAEMQSGEQSSVSRLRERATEQGQIEVAGYLLTDRMLSSIDKAQLKDLEPDCLTDVLWTNTGPLADSPPPANAQSLISSWQSADTSVTYKRIRGPQFWMSPEIQEVPELVAVTTEYLARGDI